MEDERDDYLLLSGIQHFAFCPRQWALAYIEDIWEENYLTAQGRLLHERVDDPWFNELHKGKIISRSVPIKSETLKMQGVADVVEFTVDEDGVAVPGKRGLWSVRPVEYKRGKPKAEDCDKLQLCAQAMCLEEMLQTKVAAGEIFYGQIRRRTEISFDDGLRSSVINMAGDMHDMFSKAEIPKPKNGKHCKACSLINNCQPELDAKANKVNAYIEKMLGENFP